MQTQTLDQNSIDANARRIHGTALMGVSLLIALLAGMTLSVRAADIFWTNGTASYNNVLNWDPNTLPGGADLAINNNGTNNVVQINPGDPAWTVNDILAGRAVGTGGAFEQNGSTLTVNGWMRLGMASNATAVYTLNDGTLDNPNGRIQTGEGPNSYTVININGGVINQPGAGLGINLSDAGWGGQHSATTIVNQTAGTINTDGEIWIGQFNGAVATYNMSGTATINVTNWLAIGRDNAIGELSISDNASLTKAGGGNIVVGAIGAAVGTINQNGGAITNTTSEVWLGETGTGVWNLDAGGAYLGYLQLGRSGSADGTFNLNGGVLSATEITSGDGLETFNFNGGTLRVSASTVNFMHDLDIADIRAGGAVIDTDGYNVTMAQDLNDLLASNGGLTKQGAGTLILSGINNYSGPTMVSGGKLILETSGYTPGAVTVADGTGFGVTLSFAGGQVYPASLALGTSGGTSLDFDLGAYGNPFVAPIGVSGNLAVNGTVTVNIADELPQVGQFPLISFASKSGAGGFVLGALPVGVVATIVETASSIDLNITQVDAVRWEGLVDGNWDIGTTTNWVNTGTSLPASYSDGNPASFDDNAAGTTAVNITTIVSPNGVTFNNSFLNYTFSGSGKISGPIDVIKLGTGTVTMGNAGGNDYIGATRIGKGTLSVASLTDGGSPSAIGASTSDPENLVLEGGTLAYTGPAVTVNRGYSVVSTNNAIQTDSDLGLGGVVAPASGSSFAKLGAATLTYTRQGSNFLGNAGFPAFEVVDGAVVLDGTISGQTNYNVGEMWVGGRTNSGGSLVLSNSTLNSSSWMAVGRGNGSSDFLSSVRLEDSRIHLSGGGFSTGYDADLPLNLGIMILARQNVTLNGDSSITVANGPIFFAERRGSTTTVLLNDTSSLANSANAAVGVGGGGSLTGSTGTVQIANSAQWSVGSYMSIGNEGGDGAVLVRDSGTYSIGGDLNVTDTGSSTGTLTVQDNAQVNANNIFVGKDDNASGIINITGNASVVSTNGLTMATHWQGHSVTPTVAAVNLSGGLLAVNLVQGSTNVPSLGTFNFDGGRLLAHSSISENFMFNLAAINVMSGGAIIDSSTNTISIAEPLVDGGGAGGLTKLGSGVLYLNGANTYTGPTLVSEGSLGGTGVINGSVTVAAAGELTPGASVGTLTINGGLSLAGNTLIELHKSLAQSNDVVSVIGTLGYGGTLTVANIGTNALEVGDTFTVFPTGGSGAFSSVESADAAFDFSDGVLTVVSVGQPELLWTNLGGGVIEFSWAPGSTLAYQTNSLGVGLSTNWVDYPDTSNPVQVTNNPTVPATFFGLQPE